MAVVDVDRIVVVVGSVLALNEPVEFTVDQERERHSEIEHQTTRFEVSSTHFRKAGQ